MASKQIGEAPDSAPVKRIVSKLRLTVTAGLLAFLIACIAFSWNTRDAMLHLPFLGGPRDPARMAAGPGARVDLTPWQTAQALSSMATSAEEVELGREAERVADHEVDQAFAAALRQASLQRRALSGEALRIAQKIGQLQGIVKQDQAYVDELTRGGKDTGATPESPVDDLEIAKAQLGLDTDQLADAQQDLARASGDERARIQQELTAHEAAMQKYDAQSANPSAVQATREPGNLAGQIGEWFNQRNRYDLIQRAIRKADADADALTVEHKELERRAEAARAAGGSRSDKAVALAALKREAIESQLLGIYDDRIQSQRQLAVVYGKWSAQLTLQHRILLHEMVQSFALITFIVICVILLDAVVRHMASRPALDRRRMETLRVIMKLGIQCVGAIFILLVIFGAPNQMPTILGLTTAGLTLVLQDFIIAFFGWFVLMGKNGIRIGDWVEINGVGGEVVEIGIFRTTMLETGNWTDKGHPTGRRATFINSFAIKGQYFNFSTTGQWMWDEIRLSIPASEDTFEIIESIHKAVVAETEQDTRMAEEEWKRNARRNGLSQFTVGPAVDLRPGASGIDVIVRYVARASDRFEVRNRLYQRMIGLLHRGGTSRPQVGTP